MSKNVSWDDQRCFLAVLEEGSLSGAARRLGVSQPTVRARIAALEEALDTVLFTRSINGLKPTEHARHLHNAAKSMTLASEQFIRAASSPPGSIAGKVRLSVPDYMGIEVIPPMLAALRRAHPDIQIEMELSNRPANILEQEVDIAVRTIRPAQDTLIARKVAAIAMGFFASTDYLEEFGEPETLADLYDHHIIAPDRNQSDRAMVEKLIARFPDKNMPLRTDSHPAHMAAARAGLGIAVAQVPAGSQDPKLRHIVKDAALPILDVWLVTHEDLRHVPRIRTVMDVLAKQFARYSKM